MGSHAKVSEVNEAEHERSAMPVKVHSEDVVSAFRHMPAYGRLDYTYTVITRDNDSAPLDQRFNVFRARYAPALNRWSISTEHEVKDNLTWSQAIRAFARYVADATPCRGCTDQCVLNPGCRS